MRFLVLIAASLLACSSDEPAAAPSQAYKCTSRGFVCWDNPPLRCVGPNYRDVSDPALKTVCGKSVGDGTTDVPCCEPIPDEKTDSGTVDTGRTDAAGDSSADSTTDAATDATDATSDAVDAAEGG